MKLNIKILLIVLQLSPMSLLAFKDRGQAVQQTSNKAGAKIKRTVHAGKEDRETVKKNAQRKAQAMRDASANTSLKDAAKENHYKYGVPTATGSNTQHIPTHKAHGSAAAPATETTPLISGN
jgi:hypothetical protein